MCIACRSRKDKGNLLRVECKNGSFQISDKKNDGSRGVYICLNDSCLQKVQKTNALNRLFKFDAPQDFYGEIKNYIERKTNVK